MKRSTCLTIMFVAILLIQNISYSQPNANILDKNEVLLHAKLYLHTDCDFYFLGDSIWFRAYYLDGENQKFIDGFFNMYTDVVDKNGATIYSGVYPISYGASSGNIKIPKDLEPGNYTLRAFTDFQKELGEETFFYKSLHIKKISSSEELSEAIAADDQNKDPKIDVAFLPEGGFLLAGQMNTMGIKAIDEYGNSIEIDGKILNSAGETVAPFSTKYKGLGKVHFIPSSIEKYTVQINNYPDYKSELPVIKDEGIKIELNGLLENQLIFEIISNSELFLGKKYYFALMHRGETYFHQELIKSNNRTFLKLPNGDLPGGINRAILLDDQFNPISERLFFCKNFEVNDIKVSLDKNNYESRSNINMKLFDADQYAGSHSSLSVAVVDESSIRANGPSMNILSYLLLDSELKGKVESPSDYFLDEEKLSSEMKLDLLMLTQGWSTYIWNNLTSIDTPREFKEVPGITISGNVMRLLSKKPVIDGDVVLGLFKGENIRTYEGKTDADGRFTIDSILFTDTASVFVQVRNKKGKLDTRVNLDPVFEPNPSIAQFYLPKPKITTELSIEAYRQKYFNDLALKAYEPEAGTIMLSEVTIRGAKIEKEEKHFKIYGNAFHNYKINEADNTYRNLFDYLSGRIPGVQVINNGNNYSVIIRGVATLNGSSQPLFLLDGMQISTEQLEIIPMSVIDEIDVLKDAGETAIYGMRGANGVLAVYTKTGEALNSIKTMARGAITEKIAGYAPYRIFYSPEYTADNIQSKRPDHRTTLYWNPYVITNNGMAELSFFSSDDISNFRVYVEGINAEGKICLGTAQFSVNEYNSVLLK